MLMKRIKGCPNYFIREDGLIWSTMSNKFIIPYISNSGYRNIKLRTDVGRVSKLVHRLLAETFIDNPSNKATCNHKDGDRLNNSLSNLEWNTYSENNQHAWDNLSTNRKSDLARACRGSNNKVSKLTESLVLEIRAEYLIGDTSWSKLATKYGVSKGNIGHILNRQSWTHI